MPPDSNVPSGNVAHHFLAHAALDLRADSCQQHFIVGRFELSVARDGGRDGPSSAPPAAICPRKPKAECPVRA